MGAFYRSEYDLYTDIKKDPERFFLKASEALNIVGRMDQEEDIKDAVIEITNSANFENGYLPSKILLEILQNTIGVLDRIKKRVEK